MPSAMILPKQQKSFCGSPTSTCKESVPASLSRRTLFPAMLFAEACRLIHCPDSEMDSLLDAASALRDQFKGRIVTYSRKVFLPVTNLCRDRCGYCTFRKDPDDPDAWTMSPSEID